MRPDLGFYIQVVNNTVKETETIGEQMNPGYEVIRQAIDEKTTSELTEKQLSDIHATFSKGTKKYKALLANISKLRPPAKVMGIHKKFERAYMEYVAGCDEMLLSVNPENGVDETVFNTAEKRQDQATDEIALTLQKMTGVLLKK